MSSSTSLLPPEIHLQTIRQLYLDAAVLEQSIQQHVEANKVGYRSSNSSHPSSPSGDRRSQNDRSPSSSSQQSRRQTLVQPPAKRSSRQQQNPTQDDPGFQIPPSTHFRSGHEELTFLRDSLKDVFETVLLADLIAAVEKSVDERLWRHVFYTPIEELRSELRKLDRASLRRQEVMDELSKLLDKGTGFYHEVITTLRCDHDIDLNSIAVEVLGAETGSSSANNKGNNDTQDRGSQGRTRNGRSRQQSRTKEEATPVTYSKESLANCVQKCFIYLGDLARYRTNIRLEAQSVQANAQPAAPGSQVRPSASDWRAAGRFYQRAIQIYPDSAKPYGQMAILASYATDDLDALYWYSLSLGAKFPSVIVRDNLKVFFSRFQNRFKDVLLSLSSSQKQRGDAMEKDGDSQRSIPAESCDLLVLFIKIQMDLFTPQLQSITFRDPQLLETFCTRLSSTLQETGFESEAQRMVVTTILIVWDLLFRSLHVPNTTETASRGGVQGMKQAQRTGLIFLLQTATVLLEQQLLKLQKWTQPGNERTRPPLDIGLVFPIQMLIQFWISHWDQIWGMIRLEEKWSSSSSAGKGDLSLRKATVAFFRNFVNLLNKVHPPQQQSQGQQQQQQQSQQQFTDGSADEIAQQALCLNQQDRGPLFGLMPFRRFHSQLSVGFDITEVPEETIISRFRMFAEKVIQASEGIRGTVVELSIAPVSDDEADGPTHYRLLDADDKRTLRERGSKLLASHWLQDQVTTLQKGLEESEYSRRPVRSLVPVSTIPGTVRLPTVQTINARAVGQSLLTDHYQRGGGGGNSSTQRTPQQMGRPGPERQPASSTAKGQRSQPKHGPVQWTCVVDFSVLVWHLSEIKAILDRRRCLLIVPLDVIDRLDQAKKGNEKENQRAREAIRFLDDRLNIPRWGMSEALLVGQNVKDSLGRWSEAVPFLMELEEPVHNNLESEEGEEEEAMDATEQDEDAIMEETPSTDWESCLPAKADTTTTTHLLGKRTKRDGAESSCDELAVDDDRETPKAKALSKQPSSAMDHETDTDEIEDDDEEEEVEVRNTMNVPRVWRPILGASLFMIHKREEAQRIPLDRFVLLTEDQDLMYYASWFDIPATGIHTWKQKTT